MSWAHFIKTKFIDWTSLGYVLTNMNKCCQTYCTLHNDLAQLLRIRTPHPITGKLQIQGLAWMNPTLLLARALNMNLVRNILWTFNHEQYYYSWVYKLCSHMQYQSYFYWQAQTLKTLALNFFLLSLMQTKFKTIKNSLFKFF